MDSQNTDSLLIKEVEHNYLKVPRVNETINLALNSS